MRYCAAIATLVLFVAPGFAQPSTWDNGIDMELGELEIIPDRSRWEIILNVTLTNNRDEDYRVRPDGIVFLAEPVRDPRDNEWIDTLHINGGQWNMLPGETRLFSMTDTVEFQPDIVRIHIDGGPRCNVDELLDTVEAAGAHIDGFAAILETLRDGRQENWLDRHSLCRWPEGTCLDTELAPVLAPTWNARRPELIASNPDSPDQYLFDTWLTLGAPAHVLVWDKASGTFDNLDPAIYSFNNRGPPCDPRYEDGPVGPGWPVDARDLDGPQVWMSYQSGNCVSSAGIGYLLIFTNFNEVHADEVDSPNAPEGGHCDEHDERAEEPLKDKLKRKLTPAPSPFIALGALLLVIKMRRIR